MINKDEYSWQFYCVPEKMKINSWTTAGQAKDIPSSPNPLVKVLRRGIHWVWVPNRRRAIKEWSIAKINNWVDPPSLYIYFWSAVFLSYNSVPRKNGLTVLQLMKNCDCSLISARNIDCGYCLKWPYLRSSNKYLQSVLESKRKKKRILL